LFRHACVTARKGVGEDGNRQPARRVPRIARKRAPTAQRQEARRTHPRAVEVGGNRPGASLGAVASHAPAAPRRTPDCHPSPTCANTTLQPPTPDDTSRLLSLRLKQHAKFRCYPAGDRSSGLRFQACLRRGKLSGNHTING